MAAILSRGRWVNLFRPHHTHMCVCVIIGSGNGLSFILSAWTNSDFLFELSDMNLNETYVKIPKSNNNKKILQKLHLKMWFLQIQTTGYRKPSQTLYRLWPLYYLCQLLWKTFHCNDGRITECNFSDICNSTTEYIYTCVCVCMS